MNKTKTLKKKITFLLAGAGVGHGGTGQGELVPVLRKLKPPLPSLSAHKTSESQGSASDALGREDLESCGGVSMMDPTQGRALGQGWWIKGGL